MAGLRIVVASYLGARRSGACGYALLEAQLKIMEALRAPAVDKVMMVVSGSFDAERMQPLLEQAARNPLVEMLFRENGGFSYGGWDHAVTQSLLRDDYLGDYFLMEDDYCIVSPQFMDPFYRDARHAYVCQLLFDDPVRHAAVSNGLLHGGVARNVLASTGTVFLLETGGLSHYHAGEHIQKYYLKSIETYCETHGIAFMSDASAYSRVLFYDQNIKALKHYGHADMPSPIVPYEYWKVHHEHLLEAG
jgi:hypothetical protein